MGKGVGVDNVSGIFNNHCVSICVCGNCDINLLLRWTSERMANKGRGRKDEQENSCVKRSRNGSERTKWS